MILSGEERVITAADPDFTCRLKCIEQNRKLRNAPRVERDTPPRGQFDPRMRSIVRAKIRVPTEGYGDGDAAIRTDDRCDFEMCTLCITSERPRNLKRVWVRKCRK